MMAVNARMEKPLNNKRNCEREKQCQISVNLGGFCCCCCVKQTDELLAKCRLDMFCFVEWFRIVYNCTSSKHWFDSQNCIKTYVWSPGEHTKHYDLNTFGPAFYFKTIFCLHYLLIWKLDENKRCWITISTEKNGIV